MYGLQSQTSQRGKQTNKKMGNRKEQKLHRKGLTESSKAEKMINCLGDQIKIASYYFTATRMTGKKT